MTMMTSIWRRPSMRWAALALALVAAAGLFLTVRAGDGSGRGAAPPAPGQSDALTAFVGLFAGVAADYVHVRTPAELAAQSDLVVRGRIARIARGRIFGSSATDPVARRSIVVVFSVERTLAGTLPADSRGRVYVELPASGSPSQADLDRATPTTADAVLYLRPAATASDTAVVNPSAGRPTGQPLYQPASPQGFVIDAGDAVVQILEHTEFHDADLRDFAPGAARFPGEG
jgi:hypothetical protein